jgi:hypothetical protein
VVDSAYFVKVGLDVVDLLLILEQTGPVLLVEVLLLQDQLDPARGVVDLALLGVNLGEQIHLDVVGGLLALGVTGEFER